ncbi:MAG: peptidoglycan-associated lipoprotein Pal [Thermochromatium sp.]
MIQCCPLRLVALLLILSSAGLVGCASTPVPGKAAGSRPGLSSTATGATTAGASESGLTQASPWEDPSSPLYQRTLYFDYDSAEIKPEYLPLIRTHARYLGSQPDRHVTLEGHADERGTREYNLALGDRRAEAVRRFMLAEGVPARQMTTLSYGEERPADPGHTEASWRLNRRVIIQY